MADLSATEAPQGVAPNCTTYSYEAAQNEAQIRMALSGGALSVTTIPVEAATYHYFDTVAQDIQTRVKASGRMVPTNDNPDATNARTAAMVAMLRLHAEGVDVTSRLQDGHTYGQMIETCLANQMMEHMHLADALVLQVNGVKERDGKRDWQTSITTQEAAKQTVAGNAL